MSRYDLIVIGGGHNGLTAAALLAKAGRQVLVLESRDQVGGLAAGEEFHPGFRSAGVLHDTGTVRRSIIDRLDLRKHGLATAPEPTPVFVPELDGPGYLHQSNVDAASGEIERRSTRDAEAYGRYRRFLDRIAPVLKRVFDGPPAETHDPSLSGLWDLGRTALSLRLLGRRDMMELLRIAPMCVADWLGEWFETDIVRAAIASPAVMFDPTGPWSPGTNLNLIRYEVESSLSVRRGPAALIEALATAATAQGAELRTASRVASVELQESRVVGVRLANGERIDARVVVASCDPKQLFLELIPAHLLSMELERNIEHYRCRGSTAKIDLALSGYPRLRGRSDLEPVRLRTGTGLDELERAFDPVKYREFALRPMLDVYVPTVEAPELAPEGQHVFSVQAHWVPYDLAEGWSEENRERLLEGVLDTLDGYFYDLRQRVLAARVRTPVDLEREYGLSGGHLLHGEHATDQLVLRPTPECHGYRTPFEGLYLCGSGSHPGGGLTCAPGAFATEVILR